MNENTVSENEVIEVEETTEELPEETTEETEIPVDDSQDILEDSETPADNPQDVPDTVDDAESVSDSDAVADEITVTYSGGEYPQVSGGDVYYIETTTEEPPFWEKPFNEYNTTEGLLLCLLIIFVVAFLWSAFRK